MKNSANAALHWKKGEQENITIAEFCGDALERKYGKKWYSELKEKIE